MIPLCVLPKLKFEHNRFDNTVLHNYETERDTAAERSFTPSSSHFVCGAVAAAMYVCHNMRMNVSTSTEAKKNAMILAKGIGLILQEENASGLVGLDKLVLHRSSLFRVC
uniref:Uncharacterized protein n=1 Tax=Arundo donax TaxID=35708 RepID=A0A0A9HB84_ARUDO